MKHYWRLFFFFAFIILGNYSFAQDLIIKKDGSKIHCKIVDENSATLYYSIGDQKTLFDIKKSDVENYYIAPAPGSAARSPSLAVPKQTDIFMLDLTTGVAIPVGAFGDHNMQHATSGLALTGFLLQASAKLRILKYLGIGAAFRHQTNAVKTDGYNEQLALKNPGITFTTESTNWVMNGLFGGLFFSVPQDKEKKLFIDVDIYAGYPRFTSPELDIKGTVRGVSVGTETVSAVKTSAFTIMEGIGVHYRTLEFIAIHGSLSFITAKPFFKNEHIVSGSNSVYYNFTQRITTINIQIGLSMLIH